MRRVNWGYWASFFVAVLGGAVVVYGVCKLALPLFLPFLLAWLFAAVTRPLVRLFSRRTGCPMRIAAILATVVLLLLLGVLCYLLVSRLFTELQHLFDFLVQDSASEQGKIAHLVAFFRGIWEKLPFLSRLGQIGFIRELLGDPSQYLLTQLQNMLSGLAGGLAAGVAALLRGLPGVFFFLLVMLIACFYFAVEYDKVGQVLARLLPARLSARLPEWKTRFSVACKRCLRAYFLLFLLTFAELGVGFFILRVEYPFLIALLGASLDILPVLGVGTVLIPWAVFALVTGGVGRGIGLLVLYVLITLVRQIAEPHLVGKSIGLHPLLMLVAFYVGIELFGVSGIVLGPALALLCKALLDRSGVPQETEKKASL